MLRTSSWVDLADQKRQDRTHLHVLGSSTLPWTWQWSLEEGENLTLLFIMCNRYAVSHQPGWASIRSILSQFSLKVHLYDTCICPIVLCNYGTLGLTKLWIEKLDATSCKYLRWLARVFYPNHTITVMKPCMLMVPHALCFGMWGQLSGATLGIHFSSASRHT